MLLDTLYLSLLLVPFAFFWCCCGVVCTPCPDGVSSTVQVVFPLLAPVTDCDYCETFSEIVFTVPISVSGEGQRCEWQYDSGFEERWCVELEYDPFFDDFLNRQSVRITVTIDAGDITLLLQSYHQYGFAIWGEYSWTKAMPDHSGSPFPSGPCPAQTITFDPSDGTSGSAFPNLMEDACDFSAISPEVTFF